MIKTLSPDVICLQETKAERGQAEIDLPEYEEFWNSAKKKGYSGTAIFTKLKPTSVSLDFPEHIVKKFNLSDGYGDLNNEGRVIALEFATLYIVTVYTPNAKPDLSRLSMRHEHWDPAFRLYMKELRAKKPVIFCGDLNVAHTEDDLANPKSNEGDHSFTKEEREGFQKFVDDGFVDTFRLFRKGNGHYTWWSNWGNARARNVGWRIDYVLVDQKLKNKVLQAAIHPDVVGSDHCPVSLDITLTK